LSTGGETTARDAAEFISIDGCNASVAFSSLVDDDIVLHINLEQNNKGKDELVTLVGPKTIIIIVVGPSPVVIGVGPPPVVVGIDPSPVVVGIDPSPVVAIVDVSQSRCIAVGASPPPFRRRLRQCRRRPAWDAMMGVRTR
jgi:hypothetical protein